MTSMPPSDPHKLPGSTPEPATGEPPIESPSAPDGHQEPAPTDPDGTPHHSGTTQPSTPEAGEASHQQPLGSEDAETSPVEAPEPAYSPQPVSTEPDVTDATDQHEPPAPSVDHQADHEAVDHEHAETHPVDADASEQPSAHDDVAPEEPADELDSEVGHADVDHHEEVAQDALESPEGEHLPEEELPLSHDELDHEVPEAYVDPESAHSPEAGHDPEAYVDPHEYAEPPYDEPPYDETGHYPGEDDTAVTAHESRWKFTPQEADTAELAAQEGGYPIEYADESGYAPATPRRSLRPLIIGALVVLILASVAAAAYFALFASTPWPKQNECVTLEGRQPNLTPKTADCKDATKVVFRVAKVGSGTPSCPGNFYTQFGIPKKSDPNQTEHFACLIPLLNTDQCYGGDVLRSANCSDPAAKLKVTKRVDSIDPNACTEGLGTNVTYPDPAPGLTYCVAPPK